MEPSRSPTAANENKELSGEPAPGPALGVELADLTGRVDREGAVHVPNGRRDQIRHLTGGKIRTHQDALPPHPIPRTLAVGHIESGPVRVGGPVAHVPHDAHNFEPRTPPVRRS